MATTTAVLVVTYFSGGSDQRLSLRRKEKKRGVDTYCTLFLLKENKTPAKCRDSAAPPATSVRA